MNKHMKKTLIALSLILSFQSHAFEEQSAEDTYVVDDQWEWSLSLSTQSLDKNVKFEGIEDSAVGFSFDLDYIKSNWLTTLTAEYIVYDDNAEFSQYVVGSGFANDGDESVESSSAGGLLVGVAVGKIHFFNEIQDAAVYGQVGVNVMTFSERSIALCDDCHSEDIDVNGGVFLKAGLVKDTGSFSLGVYAKTYVSGDLGTAFGISVGSSY